MEPPPKRLRLGQAPYDNESDDEDEENQDELAMSPTQFAARQDPNYRFGKSVAKSATRLKSAFESIFEKYEKDFTGVGDEVDLRTGEVVVDNGHLLSLGEEGNQTRESSISSDEEERILSGKDIAPTKQSHSKSLVRSNSSTLQTGPGRPISSSEGDYRLSSLAFPSNGFGGPSPFMFGASVFGSKIADPVWQSPELPMFIPPFHGNSQVSPAWQAPGYPMSISSFYGNNTGDPLWQTPELPMPAFHNGFSFGNQMMGYPQPLIHGNGFMPAMGNYANGSFNGPFHHREPKKLASSKSLAQRSLPAAISAGDESDEDDILLGKSNQSSELAAAGDAKLSSKLAVVAENARPIAQEDDKQETTATTNYTPDKHRRRRGRPRKPVTSEEPPRPDKEAGRENPISTPTTLNSEVSESVCIPTNISGVKPLPSTPTVKQSEDVPLKKNQSNIDTPDENVHTQENIESLPDSQQRRSSRARKQIEFYASITWRKQGQQKAGATEASEASDSTAQIASELPNSPHTRANKCSKPTKSRNSANRVDYHEAGRKEKPRQANVNMEASQVADDATPNGDNHDELPAGFRDPNEETTTTHKPISSPPPTDDTSLEPTNVSGVTQSSRDPDHPLPSKGDIRLNGSPPNSTEANSRRGLDTIDPTNESSQAEQNSKDAIHAYQAGGQTQHSNDNIAGDEKAMNGDVSSHEDIRDQILGVSESQQTPECEPAPNIRQTTTEAPNTQTEPAETDQQSHRSTQENDSLPKSSTVEKELGHDQITSMPDFEEQEWNPPGSPDLATSQPLQESPKSQELKEQRPIETADLALRLLPRRNAESTKPNPNIDQVRNQDLEKARSAHPNAKSPVPQTPKRRKEPSSSVHRSSDHRSQSAKKYALASLVPDDPDDEDELSITTPTYSPSSFRAKLSRARGRSPTPSTPGSNAFRRHSLFTGQSRTPGSHAAGPATDSRARPKRKYAAVQSSPLARTAADNLLLATPRRSRRAASPTESLVRTPGGTVRRCGEDGFVCDRDFCFTCCK
ncbi:hypothetical protein F4779DRAFT_632922 [Xylariaceae sp. FL0662B]|nr:hypothetical protein F4779DRAFT_632922 [Xylariaceae sp. FL0662B]